MMGQHLSLDHTYTTPGLVCVECGYKMDRSAGPRGKPEPGDLSMCLKCASANVFDENLKLRAPTIEEMLAFAADSKVQRARRAIYRVNGHQPRSFKRG